MAASDTKNINIVMGALADFTANVVTDVSLEIDAELRENTPFDTGWARANWVPSIGTDTSRPQPSAPTPGGILGLQQQGESGRAALLSYTLGQGKVFISNRVPYIASLNDGSSLQAPKGFVQDAILAGVSQVER